MNEWLTVMTSSPGTDTDSHQAQDAVRSCSLKPRSEWRADKLGEFALESRDFGPLRHPSRQDDAPRRLRLSSRRGPVLATGI